MDEIMQDDTTFEELTEDRDYQMGVGSDRARAEHRAVLDQLERKKQLRTMAVPTDDGRVRARLRELGEPITLFGERPEDRRKRLKLLVQRLQMEAGEAGEAMDEDEESEEEEDKEEEFYTIGSTDLLEERRRIAEYSLPRAKERLARQRVESQQPLGRIVDVRKRVFGELKKYANLGSQIGDDRPISQVRFSPDSKLLATGSWSGTSKIWNIPNCDPVMTLKGHASQVGGVAWHPAATLTQSKNALNLATGAADNNVNLWSLVSESPIATLKGHTGRVARVDFHPSGRYIASASFDETWRLWDAERQTELLLQEGHSKEVYAVAFQDDGALLGSGGLDAIGRVWDLRTGRTAMVLDGHVDRILGMDFSPNGYQVATGSGDGTVRIWDMRALRSIYNIPAHNLSTSDLKFFRSSAERDGSLGLLSTTASDGVLANGTTDSGASTPAPSSSHISTSGLYLTTCGFDGKIKVWSADDWQLVKTLSTDDRKIMSVDVAGDGKYIASGEWSRSFKLFAAE